MGCTGVIYCLAEMPAKNYCLRHAKIMLEASTTLTAYIATVITLQELSTEIVALPRSSTGQQGYVSVKALKMLRQLQDAGVKVAIVTGARSSTLLERLPYLPAADAVVSENGGRIFYVDGNWPSFMPLREDMQWRAELSAATGVSPLPYKYTRMARTLPSY